MNWLKRLMLNAIGINPRYEVRRFSATAQRKTAGTLLLDTPNYKRARTRIEDNPPPIGHYDVLSAHFQITATATTLSGVSDAIDKAEIDEALPASDKLSEVMTGTDDTADFFKVRVKGSFPQTEIPEEDAEMQQDADMIVEPDPIDPEADRIERGGNPDAPEHICDWVGPLGPNKLNVYMPTCSICGAVTDEQEFQNDG